MSRSAVTVRLPEETAERLREMASQEHRSMSDVVRGLTEEALRMRELPGIYFMDGATGRRARLHGGPDVWEVIEPYYVSGRDWSVLRASYRNLDEQVLEAAVAYYERYPEEIEARIRRNLAE